MAQTMRFKLIIELSEVIPPTEILSDPANPATRRVQDTHDVNRLVAESDSLIELKNALSDFRTNLRSQKAKLMTIFQLYRFVHDLIHNDDALDFDAPLKVELADGRELLVTNVDLLVNDETEEQMVWFKAVEE